MKKLATVIACVSILMAGSSCLKTRAQLKEDGDSDDNAKAGVANPIQDVQPQGQYVIDEMKGEMTRMDGRIEDLERGQKSQDSSTTVTAMKDELKKLDQRLTEVEQSQANIIDQLKKTQDAQAAASVDPADLMDKAMSQYDSGNFEAAAQGFGAYIKQGKGAKAEEATFYQGECYYNLKQYKQAIVDYSKFPEKYTKSAHMPEALFKIGMSFEALGMKDDAKGFYQELVDKFPKSKQAKKIKAKLK